MREIQQTLARLIAIRQNSFNEGIRIDALDQVIESVSMKLQSYGPEAIPLHPAAVVNASSKGMLLELRSC